MSRSEATKEQIRSGLELISINFQALHYIPRVILPSTKYKEGKVRKSIEVSFGEQNLVVAKKLFLCKESSDYVSLCPDQAPRKNWTSFMKLFVIQYFNITF